MVQVEKTFSQLQEFQDLLPEEELTDELQSEDKTEGDSLEKQKERPENPDKESTCLDGKTKKLKCKDGVVVRDRFAKIVEQRKQQMLKLIQDIGTEKRQNAKLSLEVHGKENQIQQLKGDSSLNGNLWVWNN